MPLWGVRLSKRYGNILTGTPNGASNAGGYGIIANLDQCPASSRVVNVRPSGVVNKVPPDRRKLVTLVAGSSKRWRLLMAGDEAPSVSASVNLVYNKKRRRYAEVNRTEFNCTQL